MNCRFLTNGWITLHKDRMFDEFMSMPDIDKRIHYFVDQNPLPAHTQVCVYKKGENIVIAESVAQWRFGSNQFFLQSGPMEVLVTITPKRVFGTKHSMGRAFHILSRIDNLRWEEPINLTKTLLRQIVNLGQEAIDKEVKKQKYQILARNFRLPYTSAKKVTTDINAILESLDKEYNGELVDLIHQALTLNRVVKHTWSKRKIHDIHMKWTREITNLKYRNVTTDPVWKEITFNFPENIKLINSARECLDEGTKMNHCLYTNYCGKIRQRRYVAFHVTDPEGDYTVGIHIDHEGKPSIDQVRRAYNHPVSIQQQEFAHSLLAAVDTMLMLEPLQEAKNDPTLLEFPW